MKTGRHSIIVAMVPLAILSLAIVIDGLVPAAEAGALPAEIFRTTRASVVYVNPPDLPRFGYSNGVVINSWTQPMKLKPIRSGGDSRGDLAAHTRGALKQLDDVLRRFDTPKRHIVALDIYFVGKEFDAVMAISEVLEEYFASRLAYQTNPSELVALPVRNIYGVDNIGETLRNKGLRDERIVLIPTILDPETTTEKRLFDPNSPPARRDGKAAFLVGGLFSQNLTFSVPTEKQPAALIANADSVLSRIGARREDVKQVRISYVVDSGLTESSIMPTLEGYFGAAMPEVQWIPVAVAGFAANDTCMELSGFMEVVNPASVTASE